MCTRYMIQWLKVKISLQIQNYYKYQLIYLEVSSFWIYDRTREFYDLKVTNLLNLCDLTWLQTSATKSPMLYFIFSLNIITFILFSPALFVTGTFFLKRSLGPLPLRYLGVWFTDNPICILVLHRQPVQGVAPLPCGANFQFQFQLLFVALVAQFCCTFSLFLLLTEPSIT